MNITRLRQRPAQTPLVATILSVSASALALPAAAESALSVGPRSVQTMVVEQLFNRAGRWYLIDDGGCYTYLESPHTQLEADRLVLHAHLASRLGPRMGNDCVGAGF